MLILEVGIWVVPFILVCAPGRRLVLLVRQLQRMLGSIARSLPTALSVSNLLARLDTIMFDPEGCPKQRRVVQIRNLVKLTSRLDEVLGITGSGGRRVRLGPPPGPKGTSGSCATLEDFLKHEIDYDIDVLEKVNQTN